MCNLINNRQPNKIKNNNLSRQLKNKNNSSKSKIIAKK